MDAEKRDLGKSFDFLDGNTLIQKAFSRRICWKRVDLGAFHGMIVVNMKRGREWGDRVAAGKLHCKDFVSLYTSRAYRGRTLYSINSQSSAWEFVHCVKKLSLYRLLLDLHKLLWYDIGELKWRDYPFA